MIVADQIQTTVTAMEQINPGSLVTGKGKMANSNDVAHWGKIVGFAQSTIMQGHVGYVIVSGMVSVPTWNFQYGTPIFLNGNVLSATPPGSGFSLQVGVAQSPTSILIEMHEPVLL